MAKNDHTNKVGTDFGRCLFFMCESLNVEAMLINVEVTRVNVEVLLINVEANRINVVVFLINVEE